MRNLANTERTMDRFTTAYVECALWSSSHTDDAGNDLGNFDAIDADMSTELIAEIEADCVDFQASQATLLEALYESDDVIYSPEQAGHDFWLTRNHHGAGFWDRGLGEVGDKLTEAADGYGGRDLYLGDDGLIYAG